MSLTLLSLSLGARGHLPKEYVVSTVRADLTGWPEPNQLGRAVLVISYMPWVLLEGVLPPLVFDHARRESKDRVVEVGCW